LAGLRACQAAREKGIPLVQAFLQDRGANAWVRANAAFVLSSMRAEEAVPALLRMAAEDPKDGLRLVALTCLPDFGPACPAEALRVLYSAARTRTERGLVLEAIGPSGHASLRDVVEDQRLQVDPELREVADRSARQIRIANSPFLESELVVALRHDDERLRGWAARMLVDRRFPASAHYLREALEEQLRLPRQVRSGAFEHFLLSGIRDLGVPLSEREAAFLDSFSERNPGPLPRE
jgi:HEAT repeat protein